MFDTKRAGRIAAYAAFGIAIGVFASTPRYRPLAAGDALLRVTINHAGQRLGECRERTPAELERMPANMRMVEDCPRARASVRVRITVDGATMLDQIAPARGFAHDGVSTLFRRIPIAAGSHRITVAIADGPDPDNFGYSRDQQVDVMPGRLLNIDFDAARGGVILR